MLKIPTTENAMQLLTDVHCGQWFIANHESLMPTVIAFLRGEAQSNGINRGEFTAPIYSAKFTTDIDASGCQSRANKVAVIPIVGVITKYDSWYNYGTITYAKAIAEAIKDPNICAIVLDIDSPGGANNAISVLQQEIHNAQKAGKPIIAHVDFCTSLAYWAASQCDAIFSDNPLGKIGSIGCMCEIFDSTKKLEGDGYTIITVYADESPDKNLPYRNALEGDTSLIRKNLSFDVSKLHNDVKTARPQVAIDAPGVFTGATFYPEEALKLGLIDGILTLSECIENAAIRANYNH